MDIAPHKMPDVQFAPLDARAIEAAVITGFEAASRLSGQTDFTLYDGDPRRLFLQAVALMIVQQNHLIDLTGKGNLLRYAGNATIEDIGWLYGERADRLQPSRSVTTVEFTLSAERNTVTTIDAGTRVIAGSLTFATMANLDIPAGETTGRAVAMRDLPGPDGNGMLPGQVFQIVDRNPFVLSAVNVTESAGGAAVEGLEPYRARVRNTPESFSTAGPDGAYWFWAKTANPAIADVDVWMPELDVEFFRKFLLEFISGGLSSDEDFGWGEGGWGENGWGGGVGFFIPPDDAMYWYERFMRLSAEFGSGPGHVNIVALMEDGKLASPDIREAIYDICNDSKRRPLTDFLHVIEGDYQDYDLDFTYWIDSSRAVDSTAIQAAVDAAAEEYAAWQRGELGRAIIPDKLIGLCMEAGARRLEVRSPVYKNLKQGQVARLAKKDVRYGGLERRG
ncbi:MAG: baseplate J/gp47 family protein [Oscillospiraceae bacterium]|nr:baseplate J/gp47 family protein [Oscillospiraceae bacterium]